VSRKLLLPVLWLTWLWNFSYRMMFTAIMPALQFSMQLSNEAIGLLVGSLFLGYAVLSYPFSLASGKLSEKWTICGGVVLTTISLLAFSASRSFVSLVVLGFVAGAGLSAYLPQGLSLLSKEYPMHQVGSVMGLHETAAPLGQTLGPLFVWSAIATLGWSGCLQAWSLYSFVICIMVLFLVPEGKRIVKPSSKRAKELHTSNSLLFTMITVQAAVWSCNLGLLSMLPVYLAQTFLLDVSYVAFILGISRITGAAGQLTGGYLSDRLGRARILLFSTMMVFIATAWITSVPFSGFYVIGLFFQGIVSSAFFPIFFAMISDITHQSNRAKMLGLTNSIAAFIGGTLSPAVIGFLSDRFSFRIAFLYPIMMGVVGCVGALYVWRAARAIHRSGG